MQTAQIVCHVDVQHNSNRGSCNKILGIHSLCASCCAFDLVYGYWGSPCEFVECSMLLILAWDYVHRAGVMAQKFGTCLGHDTYQGHFNSGAFQFISSESIPYIPCAKSNAHNTPHLIYQYTSSQNHAGWFPHAWCLAPAGMWYLLALTSNQYHHLGEFSFVLSWCGVPPSGKGSYSITCLAKSACIQVQLLDGAINAPSLSFRHPIVSSGIYRAPRDISTWILQSLLRVCIWPIARIASHAGGFMGCSIVRTILWHDSYPPARGDYAELVACWCPQSLQVVIKIPEPCSTRPLDRIAWNPRRCDCSDCP